MSGFTAEQITFLQAIIAAFVKVSINDAITQAIAAATINFEVKFVFVDNQIAVPHHARFARTPSMTSQSAIVQGSPPANQTSPQSESNPHTNDTELGRWRREELGTFDPIFDDVYIFTNRIHQIVGLRGHRLMQLNFSLQFKNAAKV